MWAKIVQMVVDVFRGPRYNGGQRRDQVPQTDNTIQRKDGEEEHEAAANPGPVCSMCGGPLEVPPDRTDNPHAAPQCIQCDRKPKGQW